MKAALDFVVERDTLNAVRHGRQKELYVRATRHYRENDKQAKYLYLYEQGRTSERTSPHVALVRSGRKLGGDALAIEIAGIALRGTAETEHSEWGEPCDVPHYAVKLGKVLDAGTILSVHRWLVNH